MTSIAITMMIVALFVIWGGLIFSLMVGAEGVEGAVVRPFFVISINRFDIPQIQLHRCRLSSLGIAHCLE